MDKNLNSRSKLPLWLVLIQTSPLIFQLVSEIVSRFLEVPVNSNGDSQLRSDVAIPEPINGVGGPDQVS